MWVSIYSINQSQVQRYISCKTLGHAKMWAFQHCHINTSIGCKWSLMHITVPLLLFRALYVNMVGLWVTVSLAVFSGLTMFSIYKNCDPLTNGDVGTPDQVYAAKIITQTPCSLSFTKALFLKKMVCICELAAALPCDGHPSNLPWNPWLVCGCGIQWHPKVRPGGKHERKTAFYYITHSSVLIKEIHK